MVPVFYILVLIEVAVLLSVIITGPPILRDNFLVRIQEGNKNVPIDLSLDPAAFPEPTNFSWNVNGQSLTGLPQTYSYSRVNFSTVRRSHAGNYAVFAANYLLNDPTVQVGNDSGSFYLDVLCMYKIVIVSRVDFSINKLGLIFYNYRSTFICDRRTHPTLCTAG